jgi:hypothetical protein
MRFLEDELVGGALIAGIIPEWEWSHNGGSYYTHKDFLWMHWEIQEKSPNEIRFHVESPTEQIDPALNGIKEDIVNEVLSTQTLNKIESAGFTIQKGRRVSQKCVRGFKSTEPFRVLLREDQAKSSMKENLLFVHEKAGAVLQEIIDRYLDRIKERFT